MTETLKCPICSTEAANFQKYGNTNRPNAKCPGCSSLERHRLLWLWLSKQSTLLSNPPKKTLHFAPEFVLEREFRYLFGSGYVTADLYDRKANVKMDICSIPGRGSAYDLIFCSHVLEHVQDDRKAMTELLRVVKKSGIVILQVPITAEVTIEDPSVTDPKERLRLFGQSDHVRKYGHDFATRLVAAGFKVDVVSREDFLTTEEIERHAIPAAAGKLFICKKP